MVKSKYTIHKDSDFWEPLLNDFWKAHRKYGKALSNFESKPQNVSKLNRTARFAGVLASYVGIVALKENLFPLTSAGASLGYQVLGLVQVSSLLIGTRIAYADSYRKNKVIKFENRLATKENLLNHGFPSRDANSFFTSLMEIKQKDFEAIFKKARLSKRDQRKIIKALSEIDEATQWFAQGYYAGSIDIDLLDHFNKWIIDINSLGTQKGIDFGTIGFNISKTLAKIRYEQDGKEPIIIDVDAVEKPSEPNFANKPNRNRSPERIIEAGAIESPGRAL